MWGQESYDGVVMRRDAEKERQNAWIRSTVGSTIPGGQAQVAIVLDSVGLQTTQALKVGWLVWRTVCSTTGTNATCLSRRPPKRLYPTTVRTRYPLCNARCGAVHLPVNTSRCCP